MQNAGGILRSQFKNWLQPYEFALGANSAIESYIVRRTTREGGVSFGGQDSNPLKCKMPVAFCAASSKTGCNHMMPEIDGFEFAESVRRVNKHIPILFMSATWLIWRKMEGKAPIKVSGKTSGTVLLGIVGALLLGVGMCLSMVFGKMVLGIAVGIIGIVVLLMLIPLTKGLK